jgi:hypothetical protein
MRHSDLAADILNGHDDTLEFEDYLGDVKMPLASVDVHVAMEHQLKM